MPLFRTMNGENRCPVGKSENAERGKTVVTAKTPDLGQNLRPEKVAFISLNSKQSLFFRG
jgi:hypothetical protein